ncbi:hypothetical protein [Spirosoma validum]|uniref:Uncharacterized protein n=1 Tax=Spirosoma validum TaxID=2771355 RepID=A0A927B1D9_9BACT|nr:hypothetical protein [Spirosoma validum]MBD2753785.1 hypothetical protein [Spirosoma validum]
MAKVVTLGITTISFAPIAGDGGAGTVFTAVESTKKDSAEMTQDDPTRTELREEESDSPYYVSVVNGAISFKFTFAQPDVNALALVFGGSVTAGPPASWELPDGYQSIEKTVKIVPRVGLQFLIPRAQVTAKMNGKFGTTDSWGVEVTISILTPTKAGTKALKVTNPT